MKRLTNKRIIQFSFVIILSFLNFYVYLTRNSFGDNFLRFHSSDDIKIDWHDYDFMAYEASRTGPGENGAPVKLNDLEMQETKEGYKLEGIYTIANDKISPNRSLPDVRLEV